MSLRLPAAPTIGWSASVASRCISGRSVADADGRMQWLWKRLTDTDRGEPLTLSVKGRDFIVPEAARRIARFGFADLCQAAVGAADYLAVAAVFDAVFVERIPVLEPAETNAARRFTMLIDTLYDRQIRLAASAQTPPEGIYPRGLDKLRICPHRVAPPGNDLGWLLGRRARPGPRRHPDLRLAKPPRLPPFPCGQHPGTVESGALLHCEGYRHGAQKDRPCGGRDDWRHSCPACRPQGAWRSDHFRHWSRGCRRERRSTSPNPRRSRGSTPSCRASPL